MSRFMYNDASVSQITMLDQTTNANHPSSSQAAAQSATSDAGGVDPLKRLKKAMPQKGSAHEDKPNRRGKVNQNVPVKLYISGRNLKNMDMFSKSDPLCIVFEKAQDSEQWFEIGRTEFLKDSLNPNFEKVIDVDFFFEKNQLLKFEFIDDDGGDSDDPYYDIIGNREMTLSSIMAS